MDVESSTIRTNELALTSGNLILSDGHSHNNINENYESNEEKADNDGLSSPIYQDMPTYHEIKSTTPINSELPILIMRKYS